jgi:hypothetical protein
LSIEAVRIMLAFSSQTFELLLTIDSRKATPAAAWHHLLPLHIDSPISTAPLSRLAPLYSTAQLMDF